MHDSLLANNVTYQARVARIATVTGVEVVSVTDLLDCCKVSAAHILVLVNEKHLPPSVTKTPS